MRKWQLVASVALLLLAACRLTPEARQRIHDRSVAAIVSQLPPEWSPEERERVASVMADVIVDTIDAERSFDWTDLLESLAVVGGAWLGVPVLVNRMRGPITDRKGLPPKPS